MMRGLALVWLALVLLAGGYLLMRLHDGLNFHTDLMALLPQDQQNPATQQVNDKVVGALSRHIVLLVGDAERDKARAAAAEITHQLSTSGEVDINANEFSKDRLRQMGTFYFPYREGLLSDNDRQKLLDNKGPEVATRALAQVYGLGGFANAALLHSDPFLLMPAFFAGLPVPMSRLALDDGMLSVTDNGITWILVSGQLRHEPFALTTQKKITTIIDGAVDAQRAQYSDLQILHLGAVFFAKAGAETAMHETSLIGIASSVGTVLLVLIMFRALSPILLSLLAIATGILTAFAGSLLIFGELHVGAMLFGISLIGVAVDYSLQYCSEIFSPHSTTPRERLRHVFMAITLGAATTVIGYLTFLLAPFPGLHQIAVFSVIGLIAAWLTVVAWFPIIDRTKKPQHGQYMLAVAARFLALWENPQKRWVCFAGLGLLVICGCIGLRQIHVDDDVRHMQSLNPTLAAEQEKINNLIGKTNSSQLFVVHAENDEQALEQEEQLAERLQSLVKKGDLAGFQALAQYVPSVARQLENRTLIYEHLYKPLLTQQIEQLKLSEPLVPFNQDQPILNVADALKTDGPFPFLSSLRIKDEQGGATHVVMLDGVKDPHILADAAQGLPGVRLIDPAGDFGLLLAKYRHRAIMLLALSAALMAPLLFMRYGIGKGLWIMVPPSLAVVLAPALRGLMGGTFTFFDAMALVLILSIGVDYAIFCAETSGERKPVTMLAVAMAACTALMSFGLLALSHVSAVHNFGATMLVGITIAFLLAPMARLYKVKLPKGMIALLLIPFLFGCASPDATLPPNTVSIAPGVNVTLPKVGELGMPVEASQLVTGKYGEQNSVFEARISADKDHFRFVALDMMGRKNISIDWTESGIAYDTAPWIPSQLRPKNILADMVLIYWPEVTVRKALQGSGSTLLVGPHSRTIMKDGVRIFEVEYQPAPGGDNWTGRLHYRNFVRDYQLEVQSSKITP